MNGLIPTQSNEQGNLLVSGRDLHEFLESNERYSNGSVGWSNMDSLKTWILQPAKKVRLLITVLSGFWKIIL